MAAITQGKQGQRSQGDEAPGATVRLLSSTLGRTRSTDIYWPENNVSCGINRGLTGRGSRRSGDYAKVECSVECEWTCNGFAAAATSPAPAAKSGPRIYAVERPRPEGTARPCQAGSPCSRPAAALLPHVARLGWAAGMTLRHAWAAPTKRASCDDGNGCHSGKRLNWEKGRVRAGNDRSKRREGSVRMFGQGVYRRLGPINQSLLPTTTSAAWASGRRLLGLPYTPTGTLHVFERIRSVSP
ncbi:hypothetical protein DFH09DRAFT_1108429 [Mycena vulgaris]|nr:hypothetical protein DFH09DRAFT_1108429 [Mycena vulgaris]